MGGVYRIQTFFGFLYFFYIYKAPKRDSEFGKKTFQKKEVISIANIHVLQSCDTSQ